MALLPWEDHAIITQPYASRTENVNPFNVFTFIGRVDLTPASDDWVDTKRMPARVENVEGDFSAVSRDMQLMEMDLLLFSGDHGRLTGQVNH